MSDKILHVILGCSWRGCMETIEESRENESILKAFNATFVTSSQRERSCHGNEFHPISLCNTTYKINSKVIEILLKEVFPIIMSKRKGASYAMISVMSMI
jgi:hypothetical protein